MADDAAALQNSAADTTDLVNLSRHHIPAVCRFPGRGTGFLISPGLILTSTRVVGSRSEAARLKAVFFESGKRPRVEVALLPNQFYFSAAFPEYLDYCLVACETTKIFNVTPIKLPLVQTEWAAVREGDTLLVVEHPVTPGAPIQDTAAGDETTTPPITRRFIEVQRRKEDRMFFRPQGSYLSAGCPCFDDSGVLVGLLAQYYDEGDALTCCAVSVITIVKHIFANGRISRIQQEPLFTDVWNTWYVTGDTARIVSILSNFTQPSIHKEASLRLFEHAQNRENIASVIACGGTRVILESVRRHGGDDPQFTHEGVRALWCVSFDVEDNRKEIRDADGVAIVLDSMAKFPSNEGILQYCAVLLYNLTLAASTVGPDWASDGLQKVFAAATKFPEAEVLQKFALGFFQNVVVADVSYGLQIIDSGMIRHAVSMMLKYPNNEYLNEHGVRLISRVAQSPRYHGMPGLMPCVNPIIDAILRFSSSNALRVEGNHALWGLGVDPRNRIMIFNHPRGVEALQTSISVVSSARPIE